MKLPPLEDSFEMNMVNLQNVITHHLMELEQKKELGMLKTSIDGQIDEYEKMLSFLDGALRKSRE